MPDTIYNSAVISLAALNTSLPTCLLSSQCEPLSSVNHLLHSSFSFSFWQFFVSLLQGSHISSRRLQRAQREKPWSRSGVWTRWSLISKVFFWLKSALIGSVKEAKWLLVASRSSLVKKRRKGARQEVQRQTAPPLPSASLPLSIPSQWPPPPLSLLPLLLLHILLLFYLLLLLFHLRHVLPLLLLFYHLHLLQQSWGCRRSRLVFGRWSWSWSWFWRRAWCWLKGWCWGSAWFCLMV